MDCYNGDSSWVCSQDGVAWCCELGDNHPNCLCYGNELEDLMYCPNDPSCGQSDIRFSAATEEVNITINGSFNQLCVFTIEADEDGVVDLYADSMMTIIDPDTLVEECITIPCNLTSSLYNDNQLFVVSRWSEPNLTVYFTPEAKSLIPKGI